MSPRYGMESAGDLNGSTPPAHDDSPWQESTASESALNGAASSFRSDVRRSVHQDPTHGLGVPGHGPESRLSRRSLNLASPPQISNELIARPAGAASRIENGDKGRVANHPVSKKRRGTSEARMSYPRKRSATACQVCRLRKTKCDNQRPVCGTCLGLRVECVYNDRTPDPGSFNQDSLAILERVNYAIQLLESRGGELPSGDNAGSPVPRTYHMATPTTSEPIGLDEVNIHGSYLPSVSSDGHNDVDLLSGKATTLMETLGVAANCSSNRVLTWPIFEGKIDIARIEAHFFSPNCNLAAQSSPNSSEVQFKPNASCRTLHPGRGVCEGDAVSLAQVFLERVHIKNPILDPSALMEMARKVAEEGYQWDEGSCLVLIASALASLAAEFSLSKPSFNEKSYADAKDYTTAEQYYTAARKRIGLLDSPVLATQCYFLLGVYEMYSLRPLKAWLSFGNACMIFQTYLHSSPRTYLSHSDKRLEQRLYWSCLKSECEMRDEISLPPTGLVQVDYPDVFPSPPGDTPEPETSGRTRALENLEHIFQQSWYYYLSEIASRRIANRITHALHMEPPQAWLTTPSRKLQRIAEELDAQILQWIEHLPYTFENESSHAPPDELHFLLRARSLELRERIWRPFLFRVIHAERRDAEEPRNLEYAARSLSLIFQYMDLLSIKHRHHGSWYGARQLFTKALLILAAAKSGKIPLPEDWISRIELVQVELEYWEVESPDLRMARLTLSQIFSDIELSSIPRTVSPG